MSASRDVVANYTLGTDISDVTSVNPAFSNLIYANTPAFKIVKSDKNIAGFSATSHYRISHLHKQIVDFSSTVDTLIGNERVARDLSNDSLSGELYTQIDNRSDAIATLSNTRISEDNKISNALQANILSRTEQLDATTPGILNQRKTDATVTRTNEVTRVDGELSTVKQERIDAVFDLSTNRLNADISLQLSINQLISERSDAVAALSNERIAADNDISDALHSNIGTRDTQIEGLSGNMDTNFSTLNDYLAGIVVVSRQDEITTTRGDRETADNILAGAMDTLSGELDSRTANANAYLDFIRGNVSNTDTLEEMLASFRGADATLVGVINDMASTANELGDSIDERLDYLEKFCKAVSSFLHIIDDDNNVAITFPPNTDNTVRYNAVTVDYTQYQYYTAPGYENLQGTTVADVSAAGLNDISDQTFGGGGGDGGGGDAPPEVPLPVTIYTNGTSTTNHTLAYNDGTTNYYYAYYDADYTTVVTNESGEYVVFPEDGSNPGSLDTMQVFLYNSATQTVGGTGYVAGNNGDGTYDAFLPSGTYSGIATPAPYSG